MYYQKFIINAKDVIEDKVTKYHLEGLVENGKTWETIIGETPDLSEVAQKISSHRNPLEMPLVIGGSSRSVGYRNKEVGTIVEENNKTVHYRNLWYDEEKILGKELELHKALDIE